MLINSFLFSALFAGAGGWIVNIAWIFVATGGTQLSYLWAMVPFVEASAFALFFLGIAGSNKNLLLAFVALSGLSFTLNAIVIGLWTAQVGWFMFYAAGGGVEPLTLTDAWAAQLVGLTFGVLLPGIVMPGFNAYYGHQLYKALEAGKELLNKYEPLATATALVSQPAPHSLLGLTVAGDHYYQVLTVLISSFVTSGLLGIAGLYTVWFTAFFVKAGFVAAVTFPIVVLAEASVFGLAYLGIRGNNQTLVTIFWVVSGLSFLLNTTVLALLLWSVGWISFAGKDIFLGVFSGIVLFIGLFPSILASLISTYYGFKLSHTLAAGQALNGVKLPAEVAP